MRSPKCQQEEKQEGSRFLKECSRIRIRKEDTQEREVEKMQA
jgi:hypothetical protein